MVKRLKIALIVASALLLSPLIARAASQVRYTTTLQATDPKTKIAYFYGSLWLTVEPNGVVQGWYKPQYADSYNAVQGLYNYDSSMSAAEPNGAVQGWSKPQQDENGYIRVQGSYTGGKYWLTFDNLPIHVYAVAQADGTLVGTATNAIPTTVPTRPVFSAEQITPTASSDLYPQVYNFSAKPM
jgi:hypothetical protein